MLIESIASDLYSQFRPYFVNVYECNRAYGGAEEGGWWFDVGEIIVSTRFRNEAEAVQWLSHARLVADANNEGNPDIDSVNCTGVMRACIERERGRDYPQTQPHYE